MMNAKQDAKHTMMFRMKFPHAVQLCAAQRLPVLLMASSTAQQIAALLVPRVWAAVRLALLAHPPYDALQLVLGVQRLAPALKVGCDSSIAHFLCS